jgi:hypothetical protein
VDVDRWKDGKEGVYDFYRKTALSSALATIRRAAAFASESKPRAYKSEYKKKFRPFSHYVYEANKGTFTKCREKDKEAVAKIPNGVPPQIAEAPLKPPPPPAPIDNIDSTNNSWYKEVMDLRKRAGEYKVIQFWSYS